MSLTDLTRQALRMRPDRLVVGECRGAEVRDLLAALNTGHAGGCGDAARQRRRRRAGPARGPRGSRRAAPAAVAPQAAAAFDAVLHLRRDGRGRRLAEIGSLRRDQEGLLTVEPVSTWSGVGDPSPRRPGWDLLVARLGGGTAAPE